jgi:membrane fusion protein (multidrug efflux system)
MRKSLLVAGILVCGLVVYGLAQHYWLKDGASQTAQAQNSARRSAAVPVETAIAQAADSSTDIDAIGSLLSDESVQIAPEVAGRISEIAFREGERVKEGDVLVRLDDALAKAEIADQEARFVLAKSNYDRANQLAKTGNVTERARDEATSAYQSAQATLELARVRLSKLTIAAPFSGVVGLRSASVGAFVNPGTVIVNLEKIDPLKVDFSIPEIYLGDVKVGQEVQVTVDALPNHSFAGKIYAINPKIDVNGRALRIRARLPNADAILRPGLFARVTVKGRTSQHVVSVPESAVVARSGDSFVYRIENGRAMETKVRLGQRRPGYVEILEGIEPETEVVVAGHQRLRNGSVVEVIAADDKAKG